MVTSLSLKKECENLHLEILPAATRRAFLDCVGKPLFAKNKWYLAGGTALALQVGHRQSVDLDFFTPNSKFNELTVENELLATGKWKTTFRESGTIYGVYMDAKMSLIAYPFFIPSREKLKCGAISMLLPSDIAAMKIVAISQRGRKRDSFDLYWYVKNKEALVDVIKRATIQYPGQEKNINHILKSLVYFNDAEADPMPKIMFRASWRGVKRFFQSQAKTAVLKLLR